MIENKKTYIYFMKVYFVIQYLFIIENVSLYAARKQDMPGLSVCCNPWGNRQSLTGVGYPSQYLQKTKRPL